jgi:acetyltransferase-like isoleucine patch superfamily enzyme
MPIKNVRLGKGVKIPHPELVNLYGCEIGDNCFIGPFVEVQSDVKIGSGTRIQSHSFICSKVRIGKDVFVGHGVMFINDRYPVRRNPKDWEEIIIEDGAVIGSNATLLPCRIGKGALVGAGAVVTKNIPARKIVAGNPAKLVGERK